MKEGDAVCHPISEQFEDDIQFPLVGWVSVTFSHCGWGPLSDQPVTGAGEELVLVEADLPAPRSVQGLTNQEPDSFKP